MSAPEPLCNLLKINLTTLSKIEKILLDADLYARICEELKEIYRKEYRDYFYSMKFTREKENTMLETHLCRLIIRDIILSNQYTNAGIARYTDSHEDVIQNIGKGNTPSAALLRRLIELHREVRPDWYREIFKKIRTLYLATASNQI